MSEIAITTGADAAAEAGPIPRPSPFVADVATVLPPGALALLDDLDNAAPVAAKSPEPDDDVAVLDFVGDELPLVVLPLKYPFRWDGERHDTITVRQLTTAAMGKISTEWARTGKPPPLMDIYAVMTGLPARVLRGLPQADGDRVIGAAYDFLPPSYRGEGG